MNNCTPYEAFLQDSLFMLVSLLGTALFFALAGYYLGKKSNKPKNNDSKYLAELEDCKQKYNQLKIATTSGKIEVKTSSISNENIEKLGLKTSNSQPEVINEAISEKNNSNEIDSKQPIEESQNTTQTTNDVDNSNNIEELKKKLGIGVDANPNLNLDMLKMYFGTQYAIDDLKIIEGIGPRIAQILNENGINTWKELASSDSEKIRETLLSIGGAAYKIHEPTTWPKQAQLAYEGKFEELKKLQDELKNGKE